MRSIHNATCLGRPVLFKTANLRRDVVVSDSGRCEKTFQRDLTETFPPYSSSFFSSFFSFFAASLSLMTSALEWFFLIHFQIPLASRPPSYLIGSFSPAF